MSQRLIRTSAVVVLLAFAATGCRTSRPVLAEQSSVTEAAPVRSLRGLFGPGDPRMPGTYDLFVCFRVPCAPRDTTAAHFAATVVLLDSADAMVLGHHVDVDPNTMLNGCFRAYHIRRRAGSFLGGDKAGLMFWHPDRESRASTVFPLYSSPDAAYTVSVVPTATGFTGHGSSGAFLMNPSERDTVVAVRIGHADVAICRDIPPFEAH